MITLIHVTDIHIKPTTELDKRATAFVNTVVRNARNSSHIFFIFSGDIANSGKSEEYQIASKFISVVKLLITAEIPSIQIRYVIVPGNHDCDFTLDSQLRRKVLEDVSYSSLGNDGSIVSLSLVVQKQFWEFYKLYNQTPPNYLFYTIEETIENKTVRFHCLNTAWMSSITEQPSTLFYPSNYFRNSLLNNALNICVWHHPYNWLTPNSEENNKKEFVSFTQQAGSIHLFGHEHYADSKTVRDLSTNLTTNHFSGTLFNDNGDNKNSGFQIINIDLSCNSAILKKYHLDNTNQYKNIEEIEILLNQQNQHSTYKINDSFLKEIDDIKIPIRINDKKSITLSDVYIFPDLDSAKLESTKFDNYIDSKTLLSIEKNSIIDGESQTGKSSLLYMFYKNSYESGKLPLLLKGSEINDTKIERLIKKAFQQQYTNSEEFEGFMQEPKSKKVLLIDDFSDCKYNSTTTKLLYHQLLAEFDKIIITIDAANSLLPSLQAEFNDMNFYSIKPLGFKKRNYLIEKYLGLKENPLTVRDESFLEKVTACFNNVQEILGNKFIPPYPVYILSILQALDYQPLNLNETSFGYCYQTLIHYALVKAKIVNANIDTYVNFLTELAYEFVKKDMESMSSDELQDFHAVYTKKFICPSFDTILGALKRSKLLVESSSGIQFGYNYILYYLSAKKISEIINTSEGKGVINSFFEKLDIEKYANILVFITHHSKDISFIEQSILSSMTVLENVSPITLEKNDPFYQRLEGFALEVKKEIIELNRNPKEEREKLLETQDKKQYQLEKYEKSEENITAESLKHTLPFHQAFRSIEILGQIIKNRKGSLEIDRLNDMITELYTTAFRSIAFLSELLFTAKEDIVKHLEIESGENYFSSDIENKINKFLQYSCLDACFGTFGKIIQTAGSKELKKQYEAVANKLNTPAAKLVSFGIISYHGNITYNELKKLSDELKDNQIAMIILRARVRSYVYMKNIDFKLKQQFASCLNMDLKPAIQNKSKQVSKFS